MIATPEKIKDKCQQSQKAKERASNNFDGKGCQHGWQTEWCDHRERQVQPLLSQRESRIRCHDDDDDDDDDDDGVDDDDDSDDDGKCCLSFTA